MGSRILVADDSLTIQKVIGITLANSGYELVECLNEENLIHKIKSEKFDLVLLDFNLSDTTSGYDLSKKIKTALPEAGLIVMLGTFDTVEDSKFDECGINDKIVKPFESSKFIKKCKEILEQSDTDTFSLKSPIHTEVKQDVETSSLDDIDSWVVDAPKREEKSSFDEIINESHVSLDPLSSEIQGWGFESQTNLEEKFNKSFPPVIENENSDVLSRLQSSSSFVSEDLSAEIDEEITEPAFTLPTDLNQDLLSEIEEDVSAEAFWAVDEVVPLKSEESETIEDTHLDEVTADLTDKVNKFKTQNPIAIKEEQSFEQEIVFAQKEVYESTDKTLSNEDIDKIVLKLKTTLMPQIELMVKEFCKETATKVSWEVIPDLAENLIKKELKEISDSIH